MKAEPYYTSAERNIGIGTTLSTLGFEEDFPRLSEDFTRRRACLLGILFEASCPSFPIDGDVLRPLWVDEAMQRASNILRFVLQLERKRWLHPVSAGRADDEYNLARGLASAFNALEVADRRASVQCAPLLTIIVSNVVALFGPIVGQVELETHISPLSLAGYRRKALALAANELVFNALKHAFSGCSYGRIVVTLSQVDDRHARLSVEDNGNGLAIGSPGAAFGIIGTLAGVLEADLLYRGSALGGTAAEIEFPLL